MMLVNDVFAIDPELTGYFGWAAWQTGKTIT